MDIVLSVQSMVRMEKAEWWQRPAVPAAVGGAILLTLGFAFCGGSKAQAPPAPPPRPARAAAPVLTSSPDDLSVASTAAPEAQQAPVTKAEATAMLAELHQLEKIGREMAGDRYSGDLSAATDSDMAGQRRCVDAMRDARPQMEKIRARTAALPDSVISIGLGAAELGACLVCVKSADKACARAKTALRDADRELSRARW